MSCMPHGCGPPPATPGSLKPHVEEPLRVCRILNARTSVALCIRGKRKAEHARPCVLPFASTRRPPLAPPCSVCSCRGGSKRLHRCKLPPAQHVPNELTESFDHWEGRFLRDLSSHRRRSVRGGRLGSMKGYPHVSHAPHAPADPEGSAA